ncbi:hypothetical protein [Sphingomonas zeae]|jgi:hypothetical protein
MKNAKNATKIDEVAFVLIVSAGHKDRAFQASSPKKLSGPVLRPALFFGLLPQRISLGCPIAALQL